MDGKTSRKPVKIAVSAPVALRVNYALIRAAGALGA